MTDHELLRKPFPPEQIGKLPKTAKRPELDFVGHAFVTDRLREAAPDWTFEVRELFNHGSDCWVLGRMTIDGVSRDDYGDGSDPKSAIGNAIRRCAMRWGVALDLWTKEELQAVDSGTPAHSGTKTAHVAAAAAAVVPESTPTSGGGSDAREDTPSSAYGEGAQSDSLPDTLDALIREYGSSGRALIAARGLWPDTTNLAALSAQDRAALIELHRKMEVDA